MCVLRWCGCTIFDAVITELHLIYLVTTHPPVCNCDTNYLRVKRDAAAYLEALEMCLEKDDVKLTEKDAIVAQQTRISVEGQA